MDPSNRDQGSYINPQFQSSSNRNSYPPRWTDPIPSQPYFEASRRQTGFSNPQTSPIPLQVSPTYSIASASASGGGGGAPTSPISQKSARSGKRISSVPNSPMDKRLSRFQSDFSYFRIPGQKSPDPAFVSHRRTFSTEAKRLSGHHDPVDEISEPEDEKPTVHTVVSPIAPNHSTSDHEIHRVYSNPSPQGSVGLGLQYGAGVNAAPPGGGIYQTVPNDFGDDDSSDDGQPTKTAAKPKKSWFQIMILILCIYSTIASAFFFIIAVWRPRYGTMISRVGSLSPSNAQLISAILAKTIELSFVSVFVTFIGQVLSRRATMEGSKGVNIAELSMRSWVTQPGTLLTNGATLKFAGLTFLGALALTATIFASFYTTASDTLVSPRLSWGPTSVRDMSALVNSIYANNTYIMTGCETMITDAEDPIANGYVLPLAKSTCSQILAAGQGYHDFNKWSSLWENSSETSLALAKRQPAPSSLDLVNFWGTWLSITSANQVNNATLAMPHAGIVAAGRNVTLNKLLQPEDSEGFGEFKVNAAVPNPLINTVCAPINNNNIGFFIAQNWTQFRNTTSPNLNRRGRTLDANIRTLFNFNSSATYQFNASIHDVSISSFEAPRFEKVPIEYNTLIDSRSGYHDPSIYVLLNTGKTKNDTFMLCSVNSHLTNSCSSEFHATHSGGNATVNCSPDNPMARINNFKARGQDTSKLEGTKKMIDFREVAIEFSRAIALGTGASDGNPAIGRVLSQLALDRSDFQLQPNRPSLAEGLAVLFGNAIIRSSVGAQYDDFWNYTSGTSMPVTEHFNAQVQTIEYSSGEKSGWRPIFYVVLLGVLLMNLWCLIYFSCNVDGFVTDWTEVENLVCIVMDGGALSGSNEPASGAAREEWKGTGGTGPKGGQYGVGFWFTEKAGRWYVTDKAQPGLRERARSWTIKGRRQRKIEKAQAKAMQEGGMGA